MKIYTKIAASLVATVFAIMAVPAQADHDTAGAELSADGLTIKLTCASFGGLAYTLREEVRFASDKRPAKKDRTALIYKLKDAHYKLHSEDPAKNCDGAQKLDDFSSKVSALSEASTDVKKKIWDYTSGESIKCLIEGSSALASSSRGGLTCDDAGVRPRGKGPK